MRLEGCRLERKVGYSCATDDGELRSKQPVQRGSGAPSLQCNALDTIAQCACPPAGACAVHGEGCNSLLGHTEEPERASRTLGIWLADAGIIFHSGGCSVGVH